MSTPSARRLSIASPAAQAALSPAQKRFNTLIKKIEAQRQALAAWQQALPIYRERHAREFEPLLAEFRKASGQFALFLEQQALRGGLSKGQHLALSEIICEMVEPLIADDDAEGTMKALFNRHSDIDHDSIETEAKASLRGMVEGLFGVDIGEQIDLDDPDAVLRKFEQEMRQKQASAQAHQEAGAAARAHRPSVHQRRKAEEAKEAGQSVREVFRKLASALHPDRETDAAERDRKTALMQRVNQAYQQKDLLSLLSLQLEVEQIDQHHVNAIAEDRLKHYNRVLSDQLVELQQELRSIEDGVAMEFGLDPFQRLAPARLMTLLVRDKQALQVDIVQVRNDQRRLADKQQLKRWIKQQQALMQANEEDFDLFD